ncbi:orotidine-5'-phosphate decarboxylase [Clostridium sp. 'deep sea']|uniref:orotidine-5'-phosphate decarboxylase n=1 Tax=Clostridium sp. 'deep sea' TaxID=2779445 RepID=UPI0018967C3C|nr:orotidine-5'-phosphate decarboxylase [Clostridium sp. 'deep sea']QOR35676.1 orotidine-5'-phosphate decarboxylase [Clostridium sp. 'deep sea']
MSIKERLIVALDVNNKEEAFKLVDELYDVVGYFKIGMQLYYSCGNELVTAILERGGKVFLDLKLHDIPNTVYQASRVIAGLGVSMTNFHAGGGSEMITKAVEGLKTVSTPPLALAVTVLTSLDETNLSELGINNNVATTVMNWAELAKENGCNGVVCSPKEIELVKRSCGKDFITVTPGIRPAWSVKNDQKRITTPYDAMLQGGDYIVIGRPIRSAENPREAALKIVAEMQEGYQAYLKKTNL